MTGDTAEALVLMTMVVLVVLVVLVGLAFLNLAIRLERRWRTYR